MDLFEAIDTVEEYILYCEEHDRAFATPTEEELKAIRICVDAAKERTWLKQEAEE